MRLAPRARAHPYRALIALGGSTRLRSSPAFAGLAAGDSGGFIVIPYNGGRVPNVTVEAEHWPGGDGFM